ncbi:MAG: STAS domain-containing protein [Anaerolineales bacterium]|nr:STAS domain-containing protein [Anaerolineales bacterium]
MTLRIFPHTPDVWTIAPDGRLDLAASRAIEDALGDLCDAGHARVVIDMTNVVYVASAGLRALLVGLRRARQSAGDVRLAALNDRVREVFEMSGFDQVFSIYPDTAAASASFAAGPG